MCGIFGAIFAADLGRIDVEGALAAIAHRGPDASGVWRNGSGEVVLGHRRLSIIDLSDAGRQPMVDESGRVVVVFNGEIYNHHLLRRELEGLGHHFRSRSDTEVIVEGYRAWGAAVVARLDGMFALAIWDDETQRLTLARDRTGKKPLFYWSHGSEIRFASETAALLASGVVAEVDPAALPSLLSFGYCPAPKTLLRDVLELPPATVATIHRGQGVRPVRYWRAPFGESVISAPVQEATCEVRRLTEAAVERRLESDVPLGAFLSGGLDSTIIVAVMARLLGRRVRTFSVGFAGDDRYDETRYARIAARAFDTDHTEFTVDPSSFNLVERLVSIHGGPFGDSSAIPTAIVAGLTRQHVSVALTGDGGDELFGGYLRLYAAEFAERFPQPLLALAAYGARLAPNSNSERSFLGRVKRFSTTAALPLDERLVRLYPLFAGELPRLLRPELDVDLGAPITWSRALLVDQHGTNLARVLGHNFESYLPFDLLVKADRASMLHSLEIRSPFLDTALVEFAARLPDSFRRQGMTTKWVLRRAFEDLVPRPIAERSKMGFGVPLATWFRSRLKDQLLSLISGDARIFSYLDESYVSSLIDAHLCGRADHGHRLWLLLTFEVWLRQIRRTVSSSNPAGLG